MGVMKYLLLTLLLLGATGCIRQQTEKICCTAILDGDTFELENGETVRLIGIDAPEIFDPGGDIARDFLSYLILDKKIILLPGDEDKDNYGRLLRYVYIGDTSVNEEMIRRGYAEVRYLSQDDPNLDYYIQLEIEAEEKKAGLWSCRIFQPRINLGWESDVPVISWEDADEYYGQYVIVEGIIVDAYNSGEVCFLNFHERWEEHLAAVIFRCDCGSFPVQPETFYLGKKVQIIGFIKEYRGRPEIIVKTSAQIRVIGWVGYSCLDPTIKQISQSLKG